MDGLTGTAMTSLVSGGASAAGGVLVNQLLNSSNEPSASSGVDPGQRVRINKNLKKMLDIFRRTFFEIDCLQQMIIEDKVDGFRKMFASSTLTILNCSGDKDQYHTPMDPVAVAMDIALNPGHHEHAEVVFLRKVIMTIFELKDRRQRWNALNLAPKFIDHCIAIVDKSKWLYHYRDIKQLKKVIPDVVHQLGVVGSIASPIPEFDSLILELRTLFGGVHTALRNLARVVFADSWNMHGRHLVLSRLSDITTLRDLVRRDTMGITDFCVDSQPVIMTPKYPMETLLNASDQMIELFLQLWRSVATNNTSQKTDVLSSINRLVPLISFNIQSTVGQDISASAPNFLDPARSYNSLSEVEIKEMNSLYDSLLFRVVPLMAKTALVIELIMTLYHYARNLRLACCMDETVKHFLDMLPKFTQELRVFHAFIFMFRCHRIVKKVSSANLGAPTQTCRKMQSVMERMADRYLLYPAEQIDLIISQISHEIHDVYEPHPFLVGQTSYEEIWHLMLTIADGIINNKEIADDLKSFCEKADNDVKSAMVMQCLKDQRSNHPEEHHGHGNGRDDELGHGRQTMDPSAGHDSGEEESKNSMAENSDEVSENHDLLVAIRHVEVISEKEARSVCVHQQVAKMNLALKLYVTYSLTHRSQLAAFDSARPHSNQQIMEVVGEVIGLANAILDGTKHPDSVDHELQSMTTSRNSTHYGEHSFRYFFDRTNAESQSSNNMSPRNH